MIFEELAQQIARLERVFGERSKELVDEWWPIFRDESNADFELAVSKHIKKEKYFPKPVELRGFLDWLKAEKKRDLVSLEDSEGELCRHCSGPGLIPIFQNESIKVARCKCAKGQRLGGKIADYPCVEGQTFHNYVTTAQRDEDAYLKRECQAQVQRAEREPDLEAARDLAREQLEAAGYYAEERQGAEKPMTPVGEAIKDALAGTPAAVLDDEEDTELPF